jgi:hypothetical protein
MGQLARPLILLLATLALAMKPSRLTSAAGQSVGNCLYECETSLCADFGNHSDLCRELRAKCQAKCSNLKYWGAIAYSAKDKGAGWSFGWNDLDKAQKEAMDRCSKQGKTCKLWAWFDNSCGALAADGSIVTWGTAYAKANADQRALLECKKAGGKSCAIQASVCSRK